MPQVGILASHGGYVTFTIHNRVKIHSLNKKESKNNIFNKEKNKTNQSSHQFSPSMSNFPEKNPRYLNPRTKRVFIISSITKHVVYSHCPLITK